MRRSDILIAVFLLGGCFYGDPRETQLENKSGKEIRVAYLDGAFDIDGEVRISPNSSYGLSPNYQFSELKVLNISENRVIYRLTEDLHHKLLKVCHSYCTLTYLGEGRLVIRKWENS